MLDHVTAEGFEAWLRSQEPNEVVGFSCLGDRCPVANFTLEGGDTRFEHVHVDPRWIDVTEDDGDSIDKSLVGPHHTIKAPTVIAMFIDLLDENVAAEQEVTAEVALHFLERAKDRAQPIAEIAE